MRAWFKECILTLERNPAGPNEQKQPGRQQRMHPGVAASACLHSWIFHWDRLLSSSAAWPSPVPLMRPADAPGPHRQPVADRGG